MLLRNKILLMAAMAGGIKPENLVSYNPETWAEWTLDSGMSVENQALVLTRAVGATLASYPTNLQQAAYYGIILNATYTDGAHIQILNNSAEQYSAIVDQSEGAGIKNKIFKANTSPAFTLRTGKDNTTAKIKDLRLFELPLDTQIKWDFENLTAEQLNEKYPF